MVAPVASSILVPANDDGSQYQYLCVRRLSWNGYPAQAAQCTRWAGLISHHQCKHEWGLTY